MYSYLKWKIIFIEDSKISVLINNTWLWLEILVSPILLSRIHEWEDREFFIYHHITEVSQTLFWFESLFEKKVFKNLIKIDGIWWKAAINILWLGVNTLAKAIEEWDDKLLSTVPWIGKKTALKIILEMKSKVEIWDLFADNWKIELTTPRNREIIDTLSSMWYEKKKIEEILKNIPPEIEDLKEKTIYVIKMMSK